MLCQYTYPSIWLSFSFWTLIRRNAVTSTNCQLVPLSSSSSSFTLHFLLLLLYNAKWRHVRFVPVWNSLTGNLTRDLDLLHQHLHLLSPWQPLRLCRPLAGSLRRPSNSSRPRQHGTSTRPRCVALARRRSRTLSSGPWRSSSSSGTCRSVCLPTRLSTMVTHLLQFSVCRSSFLSCFLHIFSHSPNALTKCLTP